MSYLYKLIILLLSLMILTIAIDVEACYDDSEEIQKKASNAGLNYQK
ncbi:hypothetical protein ORQ98_09260 [Spartinivicinus sp. A2-2]|uniref:Uncharacterized protein n=2 Tax=Spartinivicinus poritis TaxID=2994640 RepID=A0ABT5U720_9GAMM|nr:hypothetical protein [Spartinivicinus sp. A2-2]